MAVAEDLPGMEGTHASPTATPTTPGGRKLYRGWGCTSGVIDIKQWFVGIIKPDFQTREARVRCGSLTDTQFSPGSRLEGTMCLMRRNAKELNDDYVLLDKSERSLVVRWFSPLQPGGVRSCTAALAATALGAGALALPYAFSLTGVALGLVTMTVAAIVASLSLQILMVAARYTGTTTYASLLELAVGSRFASVALDLTLLLNGIGAVACILIFEGDFCPSVFGSPLGFQGIVVSRNMAVVGAALAAWPLTLPSDISALRYVAVAVPIALFITVGVVIWDAPALHREARATGAYVAWWDFDLSRWLQASAIMVNAFANHMNAVPAANQLDNPSVARIVKATVNTNLLVWSLLCAIGIGGYVSWAGATKGDFILNYPQDRPEIWVCRLMLALLVYCVLPVSVLPTAKSCAQLGLGLVGSRQEVGPKTHAMSATVLLAACTGIALRVQNVASVLGILGGLLASSIMFWFPALIYRQLLWPTQPRYFRWPVLLAILFLGTACWASVAATVFS